MILRCTRKLLSVLKANVSTGLEPQPNAEDWYANLLWFDRRKCLLLTHAGTLFSVFEADVRVAELRDTRGLVFRLIGRELTAEHLPARIFGSPDAENLVVTRTADRSVLGCMNDMATLCELAVIESGGLPHTDLPWLNRTLRRNIYSARGYQQPVELAARRTLH